MAAEKARKRILMVLMLFLCLPMAQHCLSLIAVEKLAGAVTTNVGLPLSVQDWWHGTYQQQMTLALNDDANMRPTLVRLNNQIDYSLFSKLHARDVVLGEDDYLFESPYLAEYFGLDYMGDEEAQRQIAMLKKIQDTLERTGKTFVFVFAGSKAYYYPEKIPKSYMARPKPAKTNYLEYCRLSDSVGLHTIDFNKWLVAQKDTTKHLLYNRQGTHWTIYGSMLVTDSLIKYIERRRNIVMPEIGWKQVNISDTARGTDNDIAAGLNLFSKLKKEKMSYPDLYYTYDGNRTKPKAIYIGDSYMWTLVNTHLMSEVNTDWRAWYYFKDAHTQKSINGLEPMLQVEAIDWAHQLEQTECVIIMYSPPNFKGFSYHGTFLYQIYNHFYPGVI